MEAIVPSLVASILIGLLPAYVASRKGKDFVLWWLYGATVFIVALPHALLTKADAKALEAKALADGGRKCPFCAEVVKSEAKVCRYCQRELPTASRIPDTVRTDKYLNVPDSRLTEAQLMEKYSIGYDGQYLFKEHRYGKFVDAMDHAKFRASET